MSSSLTESCMVRTIAGSNYIAVTERSAEAAILIMTLILDTLLQTVALVVEK